MIHINDPNSSLLLLSMIVAMWHSTAISSDPGFGHWVSIWSTRFCFDEWYVSKQDSRGGSQHTCMIGLIHSAPLPWSWEPAWARVQEGGTVEPCWGNPHYPSGGHPRPNSMQPAPHTLSEPNQEHLSPAQCTEPHIVMVPCSSSSVC